MSKSRIGIFFYSNGNYNLSDVTFGVPVRIDSLDRLKNLEKVIEFLLENFKTNIVICEEDRQSKLPEHIKEKVDYYFYKTNNNFLYRTKIINETIKNSKTPIHANCDTDVIMEPQSYFKSAELIRNKEFYFVSPYDGSVFDVDLNFNINNLDSHKKERVCCSGKPRSLCGGIIFYEINKYKSIGLENEFIVGLGLEDRERWVRIQKFGYEIKRLDYPLYHFKHKRDEKQGFGSKQYMKNWKEHDRIKGVNLNTLKKEIKEKWRWIS